MAASGADLGSWAMAKLSRQFGMGGPFDHPPARTVARSELARAGPPPHRVRAHTEQLCGLRYAVELVGRAGAPAGLSQALLATRAIMAAFRPVPADQRVGRAVVVQHRFGFGGQLRHDTQRKGLAELDAPLVKTVDPQITPSVRTLFS